MHIATRVLLAPILFAAAAPPAMAWGQSGTPAAVYPGDSLPRSAPGWSLARATREFVRAYDPRGLFPEHGGWTWVVTTR